MIVTTNMMIDIAGNNENAGNDKNKENCLGRIILISFCFKAPVAATATSSLGSDISAVVIPLAHGRAQGAQSQATRAGGRWFVSNDFHGGVGGGQVRSV